LKKPVEVEEDKQDIESVVVEEFARDAEDESKAHCVEKLK
jgi:hypothetical protein